MRKRNNTNSHLLAEIQHLRQRIEELEAKGTMYQNGEKELYESNDRLHTMFERHDAIMLLVDPQTRSIVDANQAAVKFYGYSKSILCSMSIDEINTMSPQQVGMELQKAVNEKKNYFIFPHRLASGEERQVEVHSSPILIQDKQMLFSIIHDITERQQIESALATEKRRLADILKGTNAGTWEWNIQTREVILNERWAEIIGYTLQELSPISIDTWTQHVHAEDLKSAHELLERHFRGQLDYYTIETRMRHKSGIWVWVLNRGKVATWTKDGRPLLMSGTSQDITERKYSESKSHESEARFRSLFEQTHDAVFILDLQGRHIMANQRAADMLGYTEEEVANLSVNETSAEMEKSLDIMGSLLAGEHIPLYERLFRKKDGRVIPVEINIELVKDKNGNPMHIQSVVRDISERKHAEQEIKIANEQLHSHVLEIEILQKELREQALHDPLTGLHNRRYLNEAIKREIGRAERENKPLSVIISDIDHFKKINDKYGHSIGDKFLIEIASLFKKYARGSDIICRYGGEEFLLVLPGATIHSAMKRAEELKQKCSEILIDHEEKKLSITLSFGIATYPVHGSDVEELFIKADKALYMSKHSGRNLVTAWEEDRLIIQ